MTREFIPAEHIVNLNMSDFMHMYDDSGTRLIGITGAGGSRGLTSAGTPLGVDRIVMQRGTAFPLHIHEGDHLLVALSGCGSVNIDDVDYPMVPGDSIYIPADLPHGVKGPTDDVPFELLAFGIPHHPVDSITRMTVVTKQLSVPNEDRQ